MLTTIPDNIEDVLASLPPDVAALVFDPANGEKILAIGKRYGLNLDQTGKLMTATRLVMIGLLPTDSFKGEIMSGLAIASDVADKIVADVSTEIVRDAIAKMQQHAENETHHFTDEEIEAMLAEDDDQAEAANSLAQTGIELIAEPEQAAAAEEKTLDRDQLLQSVEHPSAPQTPSIADEVQRGITGEKLAGNFKIPREERDYSINKPGAAAPAVDDAIVRHRDRVDPYRMPIGE
jgi:hypothetical protein